MATKLEKPLRRELAVNEELYTLTISPEGRVVQSTDLLRSVFVGAWSSYVCMTSGGPEWDGASRSYFVLLDRREYFCARTWWGQRVLLDLERGELADDALHVDALSALEACWALQTLEALSTVSWSGAESDPSRAAGFLEAALPALVSVTAGAVEPRYPTFKGIMDAKKKPVEKLTLADLGVAAAVTQQVVAVEDAAARSGGSVIEDDGQAHLRIVELLEARKVV